MNDMAPRQFSYDPYSKAVLANPVPYYAELRANHPGYYVEKYDMFVFTRFQDIIDVLGVTGDNAFIGSESTLPTPEAISHRNHGAPPMPPTNPMIQGPMLPSPEYEEMRLAFMKPLRPKSVQALQEFMREIVLERLRILLPQGKFDLLNDYGAVLSASVTCKLFGIPMDQVLAVRDAVAALSHYNDEMEAVDVPGMFTKLTNFIYPAIERRRAAGADGSVPLIDGLINYRTKPDQRALTTPEIADQLVSTFIANSETPPRPSAQGLFMLSQHPDQLAAVRADLDTNVPIAVEEMLRLGSTAQWTIRTAHKDVSVAGVNIKAGQRVLISPYAASRDEREFENANSFIWNRKIGRSLTFGHGQHHCVGNHVARQQIRTLVREFLAHVQDFEFDLDDAKHSASYFHWGFLRLPVIVKSYTI